MNTHDKIKLPPHDATANLNGSPPVRLYSEAKVRAAIEADRKLQHSPAYEEGWKDALEWADRKRGGEPKDRRDIRGIVKKLQSAYVKDGSTDEWVRLRRHVLEEAIDTLRLVSADCAHFYESYKAACERATQPAEPVKVPTNAQIREVFLANGFTIKPGHDDLKPYVYEAARELLRRYGASEWEDFPK